MGGLTSDYGKVVEYSERMAWTIGDVFPPGVLLDFSRPFMPSALFRADELSFLSKAELLKLNQIYGNGYAYIFYFVEAYIIDLAMRHAQAERHGDDDTLRAMLRFADEEVKHQKMFLRFGELFKGGFGSECHLVESPGRVAEYILGKSPLAVMLMTLHLELITQAHYVECIRDRMELDALFQSLFKHHWIEEAQHAKIDALVIAKLVPEMAQPLVTQAVTEYCEMAGAFAELFAQQARLDVLSLETALARSFEPDERTAIEGAQRRGYQRTFLWSGVTNTAFLEFLAEHVPEALEGTSKIASALA